MYSDPSQIRRHKYSFTLNDAEKALIDAVIGYTGGNSVVPLNAEAIVRANLIGDVELARRVA